jgi:hypothetical protein
MSLPAREQQVLEGIETALQAGEARLTSMFVLFTRLAGDEEKPGTEELGPRHAMGRRSRDAGWRSTSARQLTIGQQGVLLRAVISLTVAIAALMSIMFLAMNTTSARTCGPVNATHSSGSAPSQPRTCQSSQSVPTSGLVP